MPSRRKAGDATPECLYWMAKAVMAACFTGRCPKADEATLKMQRQQVEQAVKELGRIPIGEYSLACCIYRCGLNVCVRLSFTH